MPVKPIFVKGSVCLIDTDVCIPCSIFAFIFTNPSVTQCVLVTLICFFSIWSARHFNVNFMVGDCTCIPIFFVFKCPDCRTSTEFRRNFCHYLITSRCIIIFRCDCCTCSFSVCTLRTIFIDTF